MKKQPVEKCKPISSEKSAAKVAKTEPTKTKQSDDDYGPDMLSFICSNCKTKYFDTGHYFTGIKSKKCLWCTKYPGRII